MLFRDLVRQVAEYDLGMQRGISDLSLLDRMFYSVLSYSSLFSPMLLSAVELYKYYLNELLALDFRKPEAFISAAEREIAGLNPRRKADAEKIAWLQDLIIDRNNLIKTIGKKREDLSRELENIIKYVKGNIALISGRCEKAIIFLVQLQTGGNEERRLIEDIKSRFKEDLKDGIERGDVTKEVIAAAKRDLAVLSQEIAALMREDVYALSSLYEVIQEHTKMIVEQLAALLAERRIAKAQGLIAERNLFSRAEEALVALIADLNLVFKPVEPSSRTRHGAILEQKREEMLASFQEHVRRERRTTRMDRRIGTDRRKIKNPNYKGEERRSGKDRRTGKSRRRE
jgi:hypothetical protein